MLTTAIMGNGPEELVPNLSRYQNTVDIWIGADRGALVLLNKGIMPDYAVGDFDSMNFDDLTKIKKEASIFEEHPVEKDETDLDIALNKAYSLNTSRLYLFGTTGGRLDHALMNVQLLYPVENRGISGTVIDKRNCLELVSAGKHSITDDTDYPTISFIPFTRKVTGLSLHGFYYGLKNETLNWGSTRCISNNLISTSGTFSFDDGILLVIKSSDV